MHFTLLCIYILFFDSVIAAVKSETSADELSTPYKRILLSQIQQRLANSELEEQSPTENLVYNTSGSITDGSTTNGTASSESATNHRKKGQPTKHITSDVYEQRMMFDGHQYPQQFGTLNEPEEYDDGDESNSSSSQLPRESPALGEAMVIDEGEDNSADASNAHSPANSNGNASGEGSSSRFFIIEFFYIFALLALRYD